MTTLTAALILAAAISTASARRFELSNTGIRVVWSGANQLTFNPGTGLEVVCEVTIEGTFHSRTISKVSGQLIGFITRAIVHHPCSSNEGFALNGTEVQPAGTVPNTLPWHIRDDSFRGALPNINNVRLQLVGAAFLVNLSGVTCLYTSTAAFPLFGDVTINTTTRQANPLNVDSTRGIRKSSGGFFCPETGFLAGSGRITLLGSTTTLIFVRLVA